MAGLYLVKPYNHNTELSMQTKLRIYKNSKALHLFLCRIYKYNGNYIILFFSEEYMRDMIMKEFQWIRFIDVNWRASIDLTYLKQYFTRSEGSKSRIKSQEPRFQPWTYQFSFTLIDSESKWCLVNFILCTCLHLERHVFIRINIYTLKSGIRNQEKHLFTHAYFDTLFSLSCVP